MEVHHPSPGLHVVLDQLTADDTGKTAGSADVRLVLNGKPEGGVATYPIGPGLQTIPGYINRDGLPAGDYAIAVQLRVTGASLLVSRASEFSLRPLDVPPS